MGHSGNFDGEEQESQADRLDAGRYTTSQNTVTPNTAVANTVNPDDVFLGSPGPFQIIDNDGKGEAPLSAPRRRYSCHHYDTCLNLAAALNWDSFTCRGCCGGVDQSLLWRAHQARRRDEVAGRLCDIPELACVEEAEPSPKGTSRRKVVA